VLFLDEQRTEPYKRYGVGAAQTKNVLGAKNTWQWWALLDFAKCGA